jgi:hypothetical protein
MFRTKSSLVSSIGISLKAKTKSERMHKKILIARKKTSSYEPKHTIQKKGVAFAINSDLVVNFLNTEN